MVLFLQLPVYLYVPSCVLMRPQLLLLEIIVSILPPHILPVDFLVLVDFEVVVYLQLFMLSLLPFQLLLQFSYLGTVTAQQPPQILHLEIIIPPHLVCEGRIIVHLGVVLDQETLLFLQQLPEPE